jgi:hypothetical protein
MTLTITADTDSLDSWIRNMNSMNITQKYISLLVDLIILGLLGAGCSISSGTAPVQTRIALQATQTTPMTATAPTQNTPTQIAPFRADLSCWQMIPLQVGNGITGSLLLDYGDAGFYYWDVSSFRATFFADTKTEWWNLPPDRGFVPIGMSQNKIILTSPTNSSVTFDLPIPPGNDGLNYLINGQILAASSSTLLRRPVDNEVYQKGVGYTDTYYIYDQKTGDQIESHSVFLPKFTFFYAGGAYFANISYSPDGNFVLYRSKLLDGKDGFSLLDLRSNQVKWTLPESNKVNGAGDNLPYMPTWKPDASSLTYIWASNSENKDQNFYDISLDGTITQFTRFEEIFQPGYILNFNPQWSPNQRYMAFRIQKPDHPLEFELFIWDDVSKTLLNPCLPVKGIEPYYGIDWSFDSEHIILGLPYPDMPSPRLQHLMLDIPDRAIYELPTDKAMRDYLGLSGNVSPYGNGQWMNWEIP